MQKKADRRIQYSKSAIRNALIHLLQKKPIDKITVKELCATADLNRSTFYAHYVSPEELLHELVDELVQGVNDYLDSYDFVGLPTDFEDTLCRVFEYLAENALLCQVLLGDTGDSLLQEKIMEIVRVRALAITQNIGLEQELMEQMTLFALTGSVSIVKKWMHDGMKESPRCMAERIVNLTYYGFSAYKKNHKPTEG